MYGVVITTGFVFFAGVVVGAAAAHVLVVFLPAYIAMDCALTIETRFNTMANVNANANVAIALRQANGWELNLTTVPNLRNGTAATITSMACKSSIPTVYHWAMITGVTPANVMVNLDVMVRATEVILGATAHAREIALVMGVTRAVSVAAWRIPDTELVAAERSEAVAEITNAGAVWIAARAVAGAATAVLSADELDIIPYLMHMAAPVVALQGLSLVETDHHYITTTSGYFAKHKAHVLKAAPVGVREFVTRLGMEFDDAMFHKACHPIEPTVKMGIARAPGTATALRAANCPTASIRFPAVPGDIKAARAAAAVLSRASNTVAQMGGSVSVVALAGAITAVTSAAVGAATQTAQAQLATVIEPMKPDIAYCAGIVKTELDAAGAGHSTLLSSYFVKRMMDEHATHFNEGASIARACKMKVRKGLEDGTLVARNIA